MADYSGGIHKLALKDEDKWILSAVNAAAAEITANMEKFELSLAAQKVYDLIWNNYCDWYIEFVKSRLYGDDEEDKMVARAVLVKVLKDLLKLLHPVMPFITEEIWSCLPVLPGEVTEENPKGYLIRQNLSLIHIYHEKDISGELDLRRGDRKFLRLEGFDLGKTPQIVSHNAEGIFHGRIRFLTDVDHRTDRRHIDEISVVAFAQIRIHIVVFQSDGQHSVDVRRDIEIVGEIIGGSRRKQS